MRKRKKILSGKLLEVIDYPCRADGTPLRGEPCKRTAAENKLYNDRRQLKTLTRKIAANFDSGDYFVTLTYSADKAPESLEQARRDIQNYLLRVKRHRASAANKAENNAHGQRSDLGDREDRCRKAFKYIYVIEAKTYKQGQRAGMTSYHFHALISGGLAADEMEKLWGKGSRCKADRFRPDEFGPEAIAAYLMKSPEGRRRVCCSKNLAEPQVRELQHGYTNRGIARINRDHANDAEYWEKKYPGYRFIRCRAVFNNYNHQWYLNLVMYRTDKAADWRNDGGWDVWLNEPWV